MVLSRGTVTAAFRAVLSEHKGLVAVRPVLQSEATQQLDGVSYSSLGVRVAGITSWLRSGAAGQAVNPGDYLPFCFDVEVDRVAFQLAALFAGAAFVPIDPRFPDSRVQSMLGEACGGLAVAGSEEHAAFLRRNAPAGTKVVVLPEGAIPGTEELLKLPMECWLPSDVEVNLTPDSAAYVMFTSGSTGKPKGVIVPHRGITRLCIDTNFIDIKAGRDVMMHSSNPAFDYSTLEVFGPLLNGAAMQLVDMDQLLDTARLRSLIDTLGITIGCFTTTVFNVHARSDIAVFSRLRVAFTSGEVADAGLIRRMVLSDGGANAPRILCNALGHTEATTFSTYHIVWDAETGTVDLGNDPDNLPVGTAVANSSIRVVADDGEDVTGTCGSVGELWCGGRGVALGYLNRPDATAKAFVVDDPTGERWYRTGDLVRVDNPTRGSLIFVGRVDNQVKLRGNRIELDEIERALLSHPSVGSAVVLAHGEDPNLELDGRPTSQRTTRLAAYVQFEQGAHTRAALADLPSAMGALRAFIESTKPPFMVPALFATMAAMPLGSTGKIDRCTLRKTAARALVSLNEQHQRGERGSSTEDRSGPHFVRSMPASRSTLAEGSVTAAFRSVVARYSSNLAVEDSSSKLTYAELADRVVALADWLQAEGVEPGSFVPFCLPPVADRVALQLAALFCGAAFVPIDENAPRERIDVVLESTRAGFVVVANSDASGAFEDRGIRLLSLPAHSVKERLVLTDDAAVSVTPETAAYVMYTSGSTGAPKGVVVPHRAIVRLVIDSGPLELLDSDVMLHAANPAFDASTLEVFGSLMSGAALSLAPACTIVDAVSLREMVTSRRITAIFLTTSLFNMHALTDPGLFAGLRAVFFGGENASPAAVRHLCSTSPPSLLVNCYGPTEATTASTRHVIWEGTAASLDLGSVSDNVPIGRAVSRSTTRIVAEDGSDVSTVRGAVGELWCGGRGLALGYLGRPEATDKVFVTDASGERWYRTGDIVRIEKAAQGVLTFLGRKDNQVKLRGHRVELEEIERALLTHPDVVAAIVLPHGRDALAACPPAPVTRLAAYIVFREGDTNRVEGGKLRDLRSWLRERVVDAAVPALFARIGSMGHTATGKIDRALVKTAATAALAARDTCAADGAVACETQGISFLSNSDCATPDDEEGGERLTDLVGDVLRAWSEVLRVPAGTISKTSDWFELGGDSLQASIVARKLGALAGVVMQERTPAALARRLLDLADVQGEDALEVELPAIGDGVRVPLTFVQRGVVAHEEAVRAASGQRAPLIYHEHLSQEMPEHLDSARVAAALDALAARHGFLRLRLDLDNGEQWTVPVCSSSSETLLGSVHDLRTLSWEVAEQQMAKKCKALGRREFRCVTEPLFRTALFLLPPQL